MKVYLAAPYAARELVNEYAAELTRLGAVVTSSWLNETHDIKPGTQGAATDLDDATVSQHAQTDMRDIDKSDLLILLTAKAVGSEGGGGRHVETGYALALKKPVIVVGEPENVFHRLPVNRVVAVASWHEAVLELGHRMVAAMRDMPVACDEVTV